MNKKHLTLIAFVILALTLIFSLSGCAGEDDVFEGKYAVTFELNGGTLDYKTSSVNTNIKYAYVPNTYVIDVSAIEGYKLTKLGYVFTGWYTSEACLPTEKWDFSKPLEIEELTLYAGWEVAITYSYTVYYVDGENDVSLGSYTVKAGERFDDWRKFAQKRTGYTPMGYYSDRTLTTAWNTATTHPGGGADLDIPVYVKYIEGKWALVGDYKSLVNAVSNGENVYLTCDIDCGGEILNSSSSGFGGSYAGTFEGNGYTVSNFKLKKSTSTRYPSCAIFDTLANGAEIRNVSFTDVTYDLTGIDTALVYTVKASALATSVGNITVEKVTVSGTVKTNYSGELESKNSVFFEKISEDTEVTLVGEDAFSANITVEAVETGAES